MKHLLFLLLFSPTPLLAQIMIDQYVVGEYRNDVVYEGVYYSPGNCTWADGTDFTFDFQGLQFPTGIELALVVDAPDPPTTTLLNGWLPVNVGDSTTFTPSTTGMGISAASGPATLHFHIRAVGTPTVAGELYSCWITEGVTEALCDNTYALMTGESIIPCEVELPTGISEVDHPAFSAVSANGQIVIRSELSGLLELTDVSGRMLHAERIPSGGTSIHSLSHSGVILVRLTTTDRMYTQKLFKF